MADEYLRLAYHGLRAKDKSFNAKLKLILMTSLKNKYRSTGYWKSDFEFNKQCILCGERNEVRPPALRPVPPSASAVAQGGFSDPEKNKTQQFG